MFILKSKKNVHSKNHRKYIILYLNVKLFRKSRTQSRRRAVYDRDMQLYA